VQNARVSSGVASASVATTVVAVAVGEAGEAGEAGEEAGAGETFKQVQQHTTTKEGIRTGR